MYNSSLLILLCLTLYIPQIASRMQNKSNKDDDPNTELYRRLGMEPHEPQYVVRAKFRKMAKKLHPDQEKGDEQKMIELNQAYEILNDPKKRADYDRRGAEALKDQGQQQQGHGFPFGHPFADFGSFFGGSHHHQEQERQVPDIKMRLVVSLAEIYAGCIIPVSARRQVICTGCRGTGAHSAADVGPCSVCHGQGSVTRTIFGQMLVQQACPKCEGKGTMITKLCGICHGTKISAAEDLLAITVPPGAADGFEIIEEEEGDELPDHRAGNLRFIVVTSEEGPFRRNGTSNLSINMELSLVEALTGFSRTIPHFDHEVVVSSTDTTSHGDVHVIENEGLPIMESSDYGNLYVTYEVKMPLSLNEQQKKGLRDLLRGTSSSDSDKEHNDL